MQVASCYSIVMVFRKCPPQVSTPNSDLPKDEKMGLWRGGVTKTNSRLTSFEFDPAISNYILLWGLKRDQKGKNMLKLT